MNDPKKSQPYRWLQDAHTLLATDNDYLFRSNRIGATASNDSREDLDTRLDPIESIEQFRIAVTNGVVPSPNILIFVCNCFAKYLEANGRLSLDEAFRMKSKQRVGNPAQQRNDRRIKEEYLFRMSQFRAEHPEASIETAAEACYGGPVPDRDQGYVSTMAREYKRDGWTDVERMIEGKRLRLSKDLDGFK